MTNRNDNGSTTSDSSTLGQLDQLIKKAEAKEMKRLEKNRRAREKYREEKSAQRFFQMWAAVEAIKNLAKEKGIELE